MNEELKSFLDTRLREDTDTSKISVFPLPCGVGKSEYITYLLADAIINHYGLIVVTDAVNRLNEYVARETHDGVKDLTAYINDNLSQISILNSDSIADESPKLPNKPIIMMTTQRYFDYSRDEIINLTSKQKYKRRKIVFDEKIYLLESRTITVKSLNDIATMLNEGLDNTVNSDTKQWLVGQYDEFNAKLQQKLVDNEHLNNDTDNFRREIYFDSEGLTISDDDDRFYDTIKKYNDKLRKYNLDSLKDIKALRKLLTYGAMTSQKVKTKKTNQRYKNYFTVVTNNVDKLIDIGAKVFVLDGTADISPEYRLKCVNMVNCSQFKRDLSNLTINIVNVNTSKDRLTRKGESTDRLIRTIISYIKSQPVNINTVFTYKAIEDKFKDSFINVEHFNNIKGNNCYRNVNHICQVGLNRWSELIYMLYKNEIGQINDDVNLLTQRVYDTITIDDVRCRLILSDIEQNLYRCKIRNHDNTEKCTYTIICSTKEKMDLLYNYQPLVDMIKRRYIPAGATVNVIDTPIEFQLLKAEERKSAQSTSTQRFSNWVKNQPKGRVFKRADVKKECNLNDSQFKEIKRMGLLDNFKTEKQGVYIIR